MPSERRLSGTFLAAADLLDPMIEVSAGIVFSRGKVLCTRKGESRYGYLSHRYEFPGGKLESGETPVDALIREFGEELKADIRGDSIIPLPVVDHDYPDFSVRIHPFVIRADDLEVQLTEYEDQSWLPINELRGIEWIAADELIVNELEGLFLG